MAADARDDGFDIAFTAGVTKLSHQIESFNGTTGELLAWVRVPALSSSSDTVLEMYYGYPGSPDQQDAANTWDGGYAGVWHLGEDPLGPAPQFADSSNNPNDGTALPAGFEPSQAGGQIGRGLLFDGTNDRRVEVAHHSSLALGGDMTVEAWIRTANTDGSADVILAKWLIGGNRNYWLGKFDGLALAFYVDDLQYVDVPLSLITDDTWHHVAGVAKQSTGRLYLYVDGIERNSAAYEGASQTGTSVLQIGLSADNSNEEWDGSVDEARVSGTARSGGWILTEYNNQASPSNFYSVGPEVSNGAFCAATATSTATRTPTPTSTATSTATATPGGPVDVQVGTSSDDCNDWNVNSFDLLANDDWVDTISAGMTYDVSTGLRFTGVAVPQGATITTAHLTYRARWTAAIPGSGTIYGQATDNPPTFTTWGEYEARYATKTAANVHWIPAAWVAGTDYTSPELKSVIQEIVNRAGWASGNALVLFVVGDKSNEASGYSYDSSAVYAPKLHIEYAIPTATPTSTPTATATPVGLLLVNSSGDGADANTADGICQTSTPGECTLRAAIAQANASAGLNTIQFNLAGPGPYTFQLGSAYPDITDAVIIDGTTQPGFAGTPIVELNGSNAGGGAICLRITGANSTIRGLVINGCATTAIEISGAGAKGNVIVGNYLGTDVTGTGAVPNSYGIYLTSGASANTIGGTTAADRNVISGNNAYGVLISWTGTDANVVQGNYIGTNAAGTAALPNADTGVRFQGGPLNNMVGGTTAGARNVISGNGIVGVYAAGGNAVQGNFIGTDATGTYGIPNAKFGVQTDGVGSTVGGTAAGAGNVIAFNTEDGLVLTFNGAKRNSFLGNSIYANGHLGIDLKDDGVTSNDNLDKDNGPNDLQNSPVLAQARTNGAGMVIIDGTLNSVANTTFRLEFFASTSGDTSGYGEGERYLGFVDVTTDGVGNAVFSQTFMASVDAGEVITATAIDPAGNSSEFSAWIGATPL